MKQDGIFGQEVAATASAQTGVAEQIRMKTHYVCEAFDPDGKFLWREEFDNIVCDAGINDLLDKYFKGSSYSAAWHVGLKNTGSAVAGDTMASHSNWTENTTYSNATRPDLTLGTVSGKSVDNSGNKATFNINGTTTIYGAFVAADDTKGGTSGILYGAGDFSASRSLGSGDTLQVTITLTGASA